MNSYPQATATETAFPAVVYCRVPGLIASAAQAGLRDALATSDDDMRAVSPVVVVEGRTVRDACFEAARHGVTEGMALTHARRLCPHLLATPAEQIDARALRDRSHVLLNVLADLSPVVEPCAGGGDAAYADISAAGGVRTEDAALVVARNLVARLRDTLPDAREPLVAVGPSRLAARALAECGGLPPSRLHECDARFLWPEDPAVSARLFRLALTTFGAIAVLPESALIYQFGPKIGPLLWRRAQGSDFTPVRALYPEPRVEPALNFALDPLADREQLREALRRLAALVADDLKRLGRHARCVALWLAQERGGDGRWEEWVAPAPVQNERDLLVAVRNILPRFALTSPITGLRLATHDLDLPPAATGDLFAQRAQGDRRVIVATRRMLTTRYGARALRLASELPTERRDRRRALVREAQRP